MANIIISKGVNLGRVSAGGDGTITGKASY